MVQLYAKFEDDKLRYLVLEQCSKGDLFKALVTCGGTMPEKKAVA